MSNENKLLGVASSPHVSSPIGTRSLMLDVLIALAVSYTHLTLPTTERV